MKYTDRARNKVVDALDRYGCDEFEELTGLNRRTLKSIRYNYNNDYCGIGTLWLHRAATVCGLNIAEILLDDEELDNNWQWYEGADLKYFPHNLCRLADSTGMTIYDMEDCSGLSQSTISSYMKGNMRWPHLEKLELLAESLGEELPDMFLPCDFPLREPAWEWNAKKKKGVSK